MIRTLVVDDDFRVARLHSEIVAAVPGFAAPVTCNSVTQARRLAADGFDLALVDLYLPDGSGLDLIRHLQFDVIVLSAAAEPAMVRSALSRGALTYLVKPFEASELANRLEAYRRYRGLLDRSGVLTQADVDQAVQTLHSVQGATRRKGHSTLTEQAVAKAVLDSSSPLSAVEVAEQVGVSRATANRYLSYLTETGRIDVQLRYGTTGRPEHRFTSLAE